MASEYTSIQNEHLGIRVPTVLKDRLKHFADLEYVKTSTIIRRALINEINRLKSLEGDSRPPEWTVKPHLSKQFYIVKTQCSDKNNKRRWISSSFTKCGLNPWGDEEIFKQRLLSLNADGVYRALSEAHKAEELVKWNKLQQLQLEKTEKNFKEMEEFNKNIGDENWKMRYDHTMKVSTKLLKIITKKNKQQWNMI